MFKDYFNMEIRENILNEKEQLGNYSLMAPVDYRGPKKIYKEFYTEKQLEYLFSNGLLQEYTPTGASWERPWLEKGDYYEFTERGKKLRKWYGSSLKDYLYYEVFHLYNIQYWWQKFMIKVFNKHYDWQDYVGVDLNEI